MSKFVVSARKYRPVRFDEVVGQEHVSQTLKNALRSDHLAHAFLFCGPRGVGKTTSARILAKVLNCQNRTADFEPCNACDSCLAFNQNASFNITELDAASNNSVEHIRQLNEQVRFQPQQGAYKVFIIDEVHMLSQSAFNAFLKTLEEPPPYAVFILATTEKHKIIPTILSRCQIFDFRRIQVPDIIRHLESICETEAIEAEPDALHIIAQKADGALRDALSIFDRIVSFSGGKITYKEVIENLNILDYDYYFRVVDRLLVGDSAGVMVLFDEILRKGFEGDLFLLGLSEHLRNLLVCRDEATLKLLEVGEGLQARYRKQANLATTSFLLTALHLVNACDLQYKMARNKRLHVEMALIRVAHSSQMIEGNELTSNSQIQEKKTPDVPSEAPQPEQSKPLPETERDRGNPQKVETPIAAKPSEANPNVTEPVPPSADSGFSMNMDELVRAVKQEEAGKVKREHEIGQEELEAAWNTYAQDKAPISLKTTMKKAVLGVQGFDITIHLGTKLAINSIKQEADLLEFLKTTLNSPALTIHFELDKELAPDKPPPKKMLSDMEKYQQLLEANPALKELRDRFDLRFDPEG